MMFVHVNPGLSNSSVVSTGKFSWLGEILANDLGRASVATLTFISGYLLVRTSITVSVSSVAKRRFRTLIIPMLAWNIIFSLMLLLKLFVFSLPDSKEVFHLENLLGSIFGLNGPTANLSLFFLRDLFISLVFIRISLPLLYKYPIFIATIVFIATVFDSLEPVVFRPSILLFALLGSVYALKGGVLANLVKPFHMIVTIPILTACILLLKNMSGPLAELEDLMFRAILVLLTLLTCNIITRLSLAKWIESLEPRIFESYLLHVPLISTLWIVWSFLVGQPMDDSYIIFFLGMPFVAVVGGQILGALLDRSPPQVQSMLRGKVHLQQHPRKD
jgi:hypothetical protein